MSQVRVCDQCGAKMEIEDTDDLAPMIDLFNLEEEKVPEIILCENCEMLHNSEQ